MILIKTRQRHRQALRHVISKILTRCFGQAEKERDCVPVPYMLGLTDEDDKQTEPPHTSGENNPRR